MINTSTCGNDCRTATLRRCATDSSTAAAGCRDNKRRVTKCYQSRDEHVGNRCIRNEQSSACFRLTSKSQLDHTKPHIMASTRSGNIVYHTHTHASTHSRHLHSCNKPQRQRPWRNRWSKTFSNALILTSALKNITLEHED
jgi:hypothetical protein